MEGGSAAMVGMKNVMAICVRLGRPIHVATQLLVAISMSIVSASCSAPENSHELGIVGYNYTNRYIDQFYVNEGGGGSVDVSSSVSGGGAVVCCIVWRPGTPLPQTVRVRWVAGGCMKTLTDSDGYTFKAPWHWFKEKDAQLLGPIPSAPRYLEVHFYPEERIEVAVTEEPSSSRIQLDKGRERPTYEDGCPAKAPAWSAP